MAASLAGGVPLVYPRREEKRYGTRRRIEGSFQPGERVVVIDDIVTDGASKLEAIEPLEAAGLVVEDLVILIDREQGARERLLAKGYRLHAVLTISECFDALETAGLVEPAVAGARPDVRPHHPPGLTGAAPASQPRAWYSGRQRRRRASTWWMPRARTMPVAPSTRSATIMSAALRLPSDAMIR